MKDERLKKVEEPRKAARACREIVCRALRGGQCNGSRALLVAAYLDTVIEHHTAIDVLVAKGLYGSAFALARPIYDSALRGLWVAMCATEPEVEHLCSADDHESVIPRGKKLRTLLDAAYGVEPFFQDGWDDWQAFNSYAHSGLLQLGRRGFQGGRPDGYSAWSIVEVVDRCTVWLVLLAKAYFRLTGGNEWAVVVQVLHDIYVDKQRTPMLHGLAEAARSGR